MSHVPCRRLPAWRVVLPSLVGESQLDQVVEQLRGGELGAPFVLDLGRVRHVRYRALLEFVGRLRACGLARKSVVLDGASNYIHAIFGYVLSQSDWDLFEMSSSRIDSSSRESSLESSRESFRQPARETDGELSWGGISDAFVERLVRTAGFGPN